MPSKGKPQSEQLHSALRRLIQAIAHPFWQRVRAAGISMPQMFAMRYIYRHENTDLSELARALGITNAAASQLLHRLVTQGFVTSKENPSDRRRKSFRLTEKGEAILMSITSPEQGTTLRRVLTNLTPEESTLLLEAIELLLSKISPDEEFADNATPPEGIQKERPPRQAEGSQP